MSEGNEGSPQEGEEKKPLPAVSPGKRTFEGDWRNYSVAYFPNEIRDKVDLVAEKYGYERWLTVAWAVTDLLDLDPEEIARKVGNFEARLKIKQAQAQTEKGE